VKTFKNTEKNTSKYGMTLAPNFSLAKPTNPRDWVIHSASDESFLKWDFMNRKKIAVIAKLLKS
jgi:hypothetical protein